MLAIIGKIGTGGGIGSMSSNTAVPRFVRFRWKAV
jgi:hypothetical protein